MYLLLIAAAMKTTTNGFGPLEQLEQAINGLREGTRKANKDPSKIRVFVATYPNVLDSLSLFLRTTEITHDRYH
jgi:hypothetical protein